MFAVCNASVPLAELELESLFWPARRQRYKEFLDSLRGLAGKSRRMFAAARETRALHTANLLEAGGKPCRTY